MFDDNNLYGKATGLDQRGRYATFGKALDAAFKDLTTERNDFFDSLADVWSTLFPGLAVRPGRYEGGIIFLYVRSASALFAMRPKLRMIKAKLATLPGAPKKIELRLEARAR